MIILLRSGIIVTIILIGMNAEFALQVSDRRLSWDGSIVEDEHGKSFSLLFPDFRFTVAFTGLAKWGSFVTVDWLQTTLFNIGKTETRPVEVLERLKSALNHRFSSYLDLKMLPVEQRRLDVSIVGYNYTASPPLGLAAEITNANDPTGIFRTIFTGERRPLDKPWAWIGAFGNGAALDREKLEDVRAALREGKRSEAIQGIFEKEIRRMADDPRSGVTIGKQLDHILIHSDPNQPVVGGRGSAVVRPEFVMPGSVIIGPGGQSVAAKGIMIRPVDPGAIPLTIPRVHRNHPCPCGSGSKYRLCHGQAR